MSKSVSHNRILWLDFIKGWCILSVVLYHSIFLSSHINGIGTWLISLLNTFQMPCFFAVSGYLYKSTKTIKSFGLSLYKKFVGLMIPYLIFYVFFAVLLPQKGNVWDIKNVLIHPTGDLWFLSVLFIIFLVIGIFDLLHINHVIVFLLLLVIFILGHIMPLGSSHIVLFGLNHIPDFLFFLLGGFIKEDLKFLKRHVLTVFILSTVLAIVMIPLYGKELFLVINSLLPQMCSIFIIFILANFIDDIDKSNNIYLYFVKYGRCTLIIYIMHFVPMYFAVQLLNKVPNFILLKYVFITIIVWIICVIICYLSKRIKVLNYIFYPRHLLDKYVMSKLL